MHLRLLWLLLSVPTCRCSWSCTCSGGRDSWECLYPRRSRRERWFVAGVRHRRSGRRPDRSRTACRSCIWWEPLFSGREAEVGRTSTPPICSAFRVLAFTWNMQEVTEYLCYRYSDILKLTFFSWRLTSGGWFERHDQMANQKKKK